MKKIGKKISELEAFQNVYKLKLDSSEQKIKVMSEVVVRSIAKTNEQKEAFKKLSMGKKKWCELWQRH